jgi:salicylate hydroxylase
MSSSARIAIVGGGLAGLAAAQALKAFGMKAEVFEAAPALGEIGAAVNISPQAVKALQAIGLGNEVAAVGTASPGIYTRNMQTGEFVEFHDRHKAGQRFGAPYYTFHRADLLDALASGLDRNAIHLGHRLSGIEERNDRVMLAFDNGVCAEAEYLIGADGVRSVTRQALYGADNPTYTGQMVWRALLNSSDVPFEAIEPTGHVQWVGPLSVACFRLMRTYKELVDLAASCANSARFATSAAVAYEFWQMAMDYQESAAKLSGGKLPDIGNPPIVVVKNAPDNSGTPAK